MPALPLVVGIGASAGGLEAFERFFANMPEHSGMAFVLVQHLDPHHKSLLAELVGRHTAIPVAEAEDGIAVSADRAFVIPPNATMTIEGGILRVTKPAPAREHRRPIDSFFASLAEDQGERAVSVVLSGTGSDGTLGIRVVKEHGGLTLAQGDLDSTAMSGMPHSAAATGLVDYIMPVEDMPAALLEYRQHLMTVAGHKDANGDRHDTAKHLSEIFALLRAGTGHDFRQYKPNTLMRRIQRRMQVLRVDTVPAFLARLRKEPRQVELLFRELLIGVTQFFRNPESFDALQASALPALLNSKTDDDTLRIWVPGCATGEEVYSIAILVSEAMEQFGVALKVQVFGTDIDESAVAVARAARYRKPMAGLSRERDERWFASDGEDCCPIKKIREMCVFSTHNVVKDPPFSKLDLISCRNLMIYMSAELQERVIRTFHYALRPGGYLCLGQSEGIGRSGKLFEAIDKKHRIFRRLDNASPITPGFVLAGPVDMTRPVPRVPQAPRAPDLIDQGARHVMEKHSPAYVVIDRQYEILRFSGGQAGRYLEPSPGQANLNLLGIARKAFRPALRTAVREAFTEGTVTTETLTIRVDGQPRSVKLIVEPIRDSSAKEGLCVVAFQEVGQAATPAEVPTATAHPDLQGLEQELQVAKVQLQSTIDELETANEEMKSANEEYQSVNEELQSSNEELETAKEEMQSTNEELETINAELSGKNQTLTRLNSDLKNLFESTQIATIFLDAKLRIKTFTPGVTDLFHLRDSDIGRPITDMVPRMVYTNLQHDVAKVLRELAMIEREVQVADDDTVFLMRIRPYRTTDNVIDGVVITFVDITERKRHEIAAARLAAIVETSQDAIIGHGFDGVITSWNAGAERIFGYTADEAIGKPFSILLSDDQSDEVPAILDTLRRGETVAHFEVDRFRKDGAQIDVSLSISPIKNRRGKVIAASTIAREFTERKLAEQHKSLLIAELDHRIRNTLAIVTSLIAQTARSAESPQAFVEAMEGRIQALSRVHGLLTQSDLDQAELRDLVERGLAPYRSKRRKNIFLGESESIVLKPKAILPLAMALHELATNATKYGALSQPGGNVEVSWRVRHTNGTPYLAIDWRETGGPRVSPPTRRGFGSKLIERAASYELQAIVQRDFLEEGVRCTIEFALTDATGYLPEKAAPK